MLKKFTKALVILLAASITTTASADWPVAITDNVAFHPAQNAIILDVLSNDIGEGLTLKEFNRYSENGASLNIITGGKKILYTPPNGYDYVGEDGFWYVVEDEQGRTNAVRVTVDVKAEDSTLPAPQEDIVETPKNTSIRIDVLKNDLFSPRGLNGIISQDRGFIKEFNEWSVEGGRIEKIQVYTEDRNLLLKSQQFHLKYTPKPGFVGTDHFWYVIEDNEAKALGSSPQFTKVTINVLPDDEPSDPYPTSKPDEISYTCNSRWGCRFEASANVLENDKGKELTIKLNSAWSLNGAQVSVFPSYPSPPIIKYTPNPDRLTGEDKVWYIIEDIYGRQNWGELTITFD